MSLFSELRRRNVFRVAFAYTVTAWLVAQVAELAFDSFGAPAWVMKTLLFVLVMGLPFAVLFAWAFELTPDGLKREKDVDRSQSITQQTGRKLNYSIIGVLVVALALSLVTRDWGGREAPVTDAVAIETEEKSIAVLPFVNMSEDPENEYFSDGIAEELLNVLVKVEGLRVASRTSSFSFKNKGTPIPEIASMLNVEHVLEGSVRKSGNKVRITAQLIDVRTDSHLWSDTYDRELEDIFVIQDEISAHIVDSLKIALGAGEITETFTHPTENLSAYEDYLKAQYLWQRRGEENILAAIELLERAVEKDPEFARAWATLAAANITLSAYSPTADPFEQFPLSRDYASRALELDPSIPETHAVLGDVTRFMDRGNPAAAVKHYLKAIELGPNRSTGYLWYAEFLLSHGQIDKARENVLEALRLDPVSAAVTSVAAPVFEAAGEIEMALDYATTSWELGHPNILYDIVVTLLAAGRIEEALDLTRRNMEGDDLEAFELFAAATEDPALVDAYVDKFKGYLPPEEWSYLVSDLALLGRIDDAFQLLDTTIVRGNEAFLFWMPHMSAFRADPRFIDYLEDNGVIAYWDEYGWPEKCRREAGTVSCN